MPLLAMPGMSISIMIAKATSWTDVSIFLIHLCPNNNGKLLVFLLEIVKKWLEDTATLFGFQKNIKFLLVTGWCPL